MQSTQGTHIQLLPRLNFTNSVRSNATNQLDPAMDVFGWVSNVPVSQWRNYPVKSYAQ